MKLPQKLSLIIPVYNEATQLKDFIRQIEQVKFPIARELIFVDDASNDGSDLILETFPFSTEHQLVRHQKNRGKGAAIRSGLAAATGTIVGIQDSDFEYNPREIAAVIEPLLADTADIVMGSRFVRGKCPGESAAHYLANQLLTKLSNLFTGQNLTDMETCYKFMPADIIKNIRLVSNRFGFEPEITAKIARLNVRIAELPVSYRPRSAETGKKLNWRDGVAAIGHILRFNLFTRAKHFIRPDMPQKYLPAGK